MSDSKSEKKRFIVTNYVERDVEVGGKIQTIKLALPIDRVGQQITDCIGELYTCQERLFTPSVDHDGEPEVRWLDDWTGLSTHLQTQGHRTSWTGKQCHVPKADKPVDPVSRHEAVAYLGNHVPSYEAVEELPHWPRCPDVYYLRDPDDYDTANATGETLERFVDLFCPNTPQDRDLIKALVVSPAWGGLPGTIPMFVVTSDHGVGVGKSSTVEAIGDLYGGCLATKKGDNAYEFSVRLGSNQQRRVMLVDNVKGRQDSANWEGLITAKEIPLRVLNEGSFMVHNRWIWAMTCNVTDLSTDLASRACVVKIGKPDRGVDFKTLVHDFLAENRRDLIGDILAFLQSAQVCEIANPSRWQAWERAVLSRLPNGSELVDLLRHRRSGVDADAEDALDARMVIERTLAFAGWDPKRHNVVIPTSVLVPAFREEANDQRLTSRKIWSHLKPLLRVGPLRHCSKTRKSINGEQYSGLLWLIDSDGELYGWDDTPPTSDLGDNVVGFPIKPKGTKTTRTLEAEEANTNGDSDDDCDWSSWMVDIDD